MKIKMNEIKVASNELREQYDAERLRDLQWSLMEEGQVEPIKVCKNGGSGYEIVYGHRRYFAAQNAGWDEIEAIIVDKDEVDNLIHAGIENLAKEDLSIMEKATWAERLVEMGMTHQEISRKATCARNTITQWVQYKRLLNNGVSSEDSMGYQVVVWVAEIVGEENIELINLILDRAFKSDYGKRQTRVLAEAYKNAETPELKEQVLHTGVGKNDTWEDVLHKARFDRYQQDQFPETYVFIPDEEKQFVQELNPYVRKFYNSINATRKHILLGPLFVREELFTPASADFTIKKIDATINELQEYKNALRSVK